MDLPENKSSNSKTLWIIVGVIVALIVLGASVYAVIMATMPKQEPANQTSNTSKQDAVTQEELELGLKDLNKTMEQEKTDRENAQRALDDQVKRIKLSN